MNFTEAEFQRVLERDVPAFVGNGWTAGEWHHSGCVGRWCWCWRVVA